MTSLNPLAAVPARGIGADPSIAPFVADVVPLVDSGDLEAAVERIEQCLDGRPEDAAALLAMAYVAFRADQVVVALDALTRALESAPTSAAIADSLAAFYALAGEVAEATYYAKLAQANGLGDGRTVARPAGWPAFADAFLAVRDRPFMARGIEALNQGKVEIALRLLETQAAFSPNDGETQRALADALAASGQPRAAADVLSRFAANGTADAFDLARLTRCLALAGEFAPLEGIVEEARAAAVAEPEAAAEVACALLAAAVLTPGDPARPADAAKTAAALLEPAPALVPLASPLPEKPLVGVLATSLGHGRDAESVSVLARGLREIGAGGLILFGAGPIEAEHNALLQGMVERYVDAGAADGATLAYMVAGEGVDLLLDAGGLAAPSHAVALAHHPAGRCLAWLNAPCALPWTDGHLAAGPARLDRIERPARPEAPPTIGADIAPGQLHDDFLAALAAVLAAVPGARLALHDREFTHPDAVAQLVERCSVLGIADRIEIVAGTDVAFAADLDLLLAPFAALDANDVLTATQVGTPAIALRGRAAHRRLAADALTGLGLGAHVADSVDTFVALAVSLIGDAVARHGAAARVSAAAASAPAFSPAAFARAVLAEATA